MRMGDAKMQESLLRITLTKSPIGYPEEQKRTVEALGLRRMNQTVEQEDTPAIRGMVTKIEHLVTVETVSEESERGGEV
jgi:large subunit ribosomal protein L30